MTVAGTILLVPTKHDDERGAVAAAWRAAGGEVLALDRFWEPPPLDVASVRVYGPDTFCLVLAEKLGLALASPDDELLAQAPPALLRREVRFVRLDEVVDFPCFAKPVMPKQFRARVWATGEELFEETRGLPGHTRVIVAEVVRIEAEARCFVLDGEARSAAIYEGEGSVEDALACARQVIAGVTLPRAVVLDFCHIADRGWALLEANAAWGSGLNGCDAAAVVPCIEAVCRPRPPLG